MKKIGIFLAYAPEQPIKNQGIGRLLGFILSGLLQDPDTKITVAMPAWYKKTFIPFLIDQEIDQNRIELLTTDYVPFFLRLWRFLKSYKVQIKSKKLNLVGRFCYKTLFKIFSKWVTTSSTLIFFIGSIIIASLLLPALLLGTLILIVRTCYAKLKGFFLTKSTFVQSMISDTPFKHLKKYALLQRVYAEVRQKELVGLVKKINKTSDIDIWYVPSLFWPEIEGIKAKKVIAAPDIVYVEFPTLFANSLWGLSLGQIEKSLHIGDHYICYSDHVKEHHLVKPFNVLPEKISVIAHGLVELNTYFKNNVSWKNEALEILRSYQKQNLKNNFYLHDFNFSTTRFIFYSSQIRPHKNFFNLIKVFELLLRERFHNFKLLLTADIEHGDEKIYKYIQDRRLYRDVLWMPEVSSSVLAALNHLAICAVNPTLFEGGFPFTFTEAYSVGTPSIMSNIAAVSSFIEDEELKQAMLFDPYSIEDMAEKIEWAIENADQLFQMQAPLYEKFKQRTWKNVADEYISLLQKAAAQE